ncbi:MAG: hypothetical protein JNK15_14380, partial [Planctomycetes bacterium]|nr:hypothetical protein [Planctomycetota bacterium]
MSSSSPRRALGGLALGLLAAWLPAQRPVFTVGGANPSYASLPAAVAAVPPGSILVVRPGNHTGFTTNKPLRVLLEFDASGGTVAPAAGAPYAIRIQNLPPGDEFVLVGRGANVAPGTIGSVRVVNCSAPVVVEGITTSAINLRTGLEVQNSGAVHAKRCVLGGTPALQVAVANFTISESVVLSGLGLGAVAYESQFESVRTFFTGTGQPAVRLLGSRARFSSDGTTLIQSLVPASIAVSPIEAFDSALQLHPDRIGLLPNAASTGLSLVNSVLRGEEVPTLTATPAVPGEVATMRLTSHEPRIGAVLLGGLFANPAWFDLGNIWIDTFGPT